MPLAHRGYRRRIAAADRPYHHGDLRRALLDEALIAIGESGPTGWSMRALTRRIGVSNAASSRHFRDKRALMTALAIDGWRVLGDSLEEAWSRRCALSDVGKAYLRFATTETARFEVVCRPELHDAEDPELDEQRERVFGVVRTATAAMGEPEPEDAAVTAWALVHGLAVLHLSDMLPAGVDDPIAAFTKSTRYVFRPAGGGAP